MMNDRECSEYIKSEFREELQTLVEHDKMEFDRPPKWKSSPIMSSPILIDFPAIWSKLTPTYKSELGALSYGKIPDGELVCDSMMSLFKIVADYLK